MPSGNLSAELTIGKGGGVSDVLVNGSSVVTDNIAAIDLTGYLTITEASDTYATKNDLSTGLAGKQNTLTAGDNINIESNTISADVPEVEGNPAEAATESALTKIKIDNAIYPIESGGMTFSESEFNTGMKWTNGKTIYGIVITSMNHFGTGQYGVDLWQTGLTNIVGFSGTVTYMSRPYSIMFYNGTEYMYPRYNFNAGVLEYRGNIDYDSIRMVVYYIK